MSLNSLAHKRNIRFSFSMDYTDYYTNPRVKCKHFFFWKLDVILFMAYEAFGSSGLGYFHIGYDKEKKNMEQRDNISTWTSKRITISVISVLLAGINITLVVNMSRVFYEMTLWPPR